MDWAVQAYLEPGRGDNGKPKKMIIISAFPVAVQSSGW
jgi:hypothetical protein